jgi:hypothetical protein
MTRMNEVVQQIEAVINDKEYPATLYELVSIKKILAEITRQYARETTFSPKRLPAAIVTAQYRFFPGGVYDFLRNYDRRRQVPGFVRPNPEISCHSLNLGTRPAHSTG